ncbi:hypothetical protein [Fictibacillus barbaricus]|uniref:F0F1-type ATP synthase membrane subunit b/b n=1 Tax=Fictibacillus barbaricus TaxID=182136 RepID=A0ABU1U0Y4_9BACL|nr:hypothetical protein [Fictibacillus barbaricus]MDR7073110.1 F0F1-type ATP synthase membrane subunit b/b' [Fictibacillus barbaricus]
MEFNTGDIIYQLVAFIMLFAIISGIGMLTKRAFTTDKRLKHIEEKLDQITDEKRRERP